MKRSPIAPTSKKRAVLLRQRRKLTDAMQAEGRPECVRCGAPADDAHEPGKRSQGADPSAENAVVAVCRACHDEIHRNPMRSATEGFLSSRKRFEGGKQ